MNSHGRLDSLFSLYSDMILLLIRSFRRIIYIDLAIRIVTLIRLTIHGELACPS